jgi:RNA polymerase sigma factor (sigma-70 family)
MDQAREQREIAPGVSWREAQRFLAVSLRAHAFVHLDAGTLDDLVQDASIRLHRAADRLNVTNAHGLMVDIARKTLLDHARRTMRRARLFEEAAHGVEAVDRSRARERARARDRSESLRAALLQLFARHSPECLPLAKARLRDASWEEISRATGRRPATLRQMWHRGLVKLRRAADERACKLTPSRVA